jgi:hypothetical protein
MDMARNLGMVIIGTLLPAVFMAGGCSTDENGEDSLQGGDDLVLDDDGETPSTSTPEGVSSEVFQTEADSDGDGNVTSADIIESGAGVSVDESDLEAFQESSCAAWQVEPEPMGASLFFVVDASGSMDKTANNTNGVDKWTATRDAIAAAIEQMPDGSQVGLLGYPNMTVGADCVNEDALYEPQLLGEDREGLLEALYAIDTQMCTPTYDAYHMAIEHFNAIDTQGQKYILLMTDGQPTVSSGCYPGTGSCIEDDGLVGLEQEVLDIIQAAREDDGIKTFVLGSPGSELHAFTGLDNRWWLSEAAELGGTSLGGNCSHDQEPYCHFDMTEGVEADFAEGLSQAMNQIIGQVAQCDYTIPPPEDDQLVDLTAIHLVLLAGGEEYIEIYQSATSECTHGWYLDQDGAEPMVKLCSATCEVVRADPRMELQWLFGCGNVSIGQDVT